MYHKGASLRLAPLFFGDIRNHGDGSCDRAFPIPGGRWHGAAMTDEGDPGGTCAIGGRTQRSAPTAGYDGSCRGRPPCRPVVGVCTPVVPLIRHGLRPCHLLPCGAKALAVPLGTLKCRWRSPHPSRLRRATFPQGKAFLQCIIPSLFRQT